MTTRYFLLGCVKLITLTCFLVINLLSVQTVRTDVCFLTLSIKGHNVKIVFNVSAFVLDTINIFIRIAQILAMGGNRKK